MTPEETQESIEAPFPFDSEKAVDDTSQFTDNEDSRDGPPTQTKSTKSRRFWLALVGGIAVVATIAVGAGVGVAMSGNKDSSSTEQQAAAYSKEDKQGSSGATIMIDLTNANGSPIVESNNNANTNNNGGSSESSTSEVFDIILTHSRFHGTEFEDPNSYQSKAAKWVEQTAILGEHTPQRLVQRYVLACLYYATNGVSNYITDDLFGVDVAPAWIDETGWLEADDECTWYRISCDDEGRVAAIELYQNRLMGSLPSELALIKDSLQVIDLYQNPIHNSGDEGNLWFGELTELTKFFFGRTYFDYNGIPTVFGSLTKLKELDCSYTLYHGPLLGEAFAFMNSLEYLNIGGNSYNSSVPAELSALPNLQFLYADYCDLEGDLSFLEGMPAITEVWIDRNPGMTGAIPSEIASVTSLQSLSITDCNFSGAIPQELANMNLQQMWLYGNNFEGTMPEAVCGNVYPDGRIMKLEADCNGQFQCSCCTACNTNS